MNPLTVTQIIQFGGLLLDLGMKEIQRRQAASGQTLEQTLLAADTDWKQALDEVNDLLKEGHDEKK